MTMKYVQYLVQNYRQDDYYYVLSNAGFVAFHLNFNLILI